MEEVLNGLGFCTLQELRTIQIKVKERITLLERREKLAKELYKAKDNWFTDALNRRALMQK